MLLAIGNNRGGRPPAATATVVVVVVVAAVAMFAATAASASTDDEETDQSDFDDMWETNLKQGTCDKRPDQGHDVSFFLLNLFRGRVL